ncbi:MAG: alpha-ketoacid dehydrogenase subunit beta [Dehalococcoidia bacterium]
MTTIPRPKSDRRISYLRALNETLDQEMERDPTVILMGEDVAGGAGKEDQGIIDAWGGAFGFSKGLLPKYGAERVKDTPISEAGFIGAAVGAAATGLRPVAELMFVGFYGVCADQITNNAAKMHYMFGGKVKLPLTILTNIGVGGGQAAQHSETLYSVFTHFPGLKCVVPSDPYTAKGLLAASIQDDDPVIYFIHKQLMSSRGSGPEPLRGWGVPEEPYIFPIGKSDVVKEGADITLIGIGHTTSLCLQAAEDLGAEGINAEVIDLLSLSPLDEDTIVSSVKKTRRVVITDEDYPRCSIASDLSALVAEQAFDYLDAPPCRVTPPHASVPFSSALESLYDPSREKIAAAARGLME